MDRNKLWRVARLALLLAVLFMLAGCQFWRSDTPPMTPGPGVVTPANPAALSRVLIVYRPAKDDILLVPERIPVTPADWTPAQALQRVFLTAGTDKYSTVFPAGSRVQSFYMQGNTAYVDLPDSLPKTLQRSSATELLAVYSIVNTLTEFPEIQQVQLLIGGKRAESLLGHVDIATPLRRDEKILRK